MATKEVVLAGDKLAWAVRRYIFIPKEAGPAYRMDVDQMLSLAMHEYMSLRGIDPDTQGESNG